MSTQNPSTDAQPTDKPSVPHWTHDYTVVPLDGDCWEIIDLVTDARAASYEDGRTTDVLLTGDKDDGTADKHVTGVAGEVATAMALGLPVLEALDLSVSPDGDAGVDLELRRGVEERAIDIKAYGGAPVGDPPRLLVEESKAESGPADAYVLAQTWDSEWAVIHGWTTREELLAEGWREGPPTWQQENWTMTASMLRPINELAAWADGVGWQW
ncbi:hypothetical protein M0R89_11560 [Halorussus limi]|uniref:Uncharacterized protein n=1 Tax=Halorussus limi TaxID=2938695 RepID=A0A8U0HRA2_9EURY|nr:hypothetical protein [Halorussus limi]UPV73184.1 hypothetical protein M0R89_11560 [Halorussus limi]